MNYEELVQNLLTQLKKSTYFDRDDDGVQVTAFANVDYNGVNVEVSYENDYLDRGTRTIICNDEELEEMLDDSLSDFDPWRDKCEKDDYMQGMCDENNANRAKDQRIEYHLRGAMGDMKKAFDEFAEYTEAIIR